MHNHVGEHLLTPEFEDGNGPATAFTIKEAEDEDKPSDEKKLQKWTLKILRVHFIYFIWFSFSKASRRYFELRYLSSCSSTIPLRLTTGCS